MVTLTNRMLGMLYAVSLGLFFLDVAGGFYFPGAEYAGIVFIGMTMVVAYKLWVTFYEPDEGQVS